MNTYDLEIIGNFLAERRKACGYTQSQLAELINTSFKTISSWENGHSFPDLTYQLDLCKYLKISLEELHNGRIDKKKRLINRVVKITLYIVVFILILILPASIYLYNYYNKSHDSFHIYNVDGYSGKERVLNGYFIEYYEYNTLFIKLIGNNKNSSKDIINVKIFFNNLLIYDFIMDEYSEISLDKDLNHNDKWEYQLFVNNKELAKGELKLTLNEKEPISIYTVNGLNSNQDRIINNLKKHGFKDNKDGTLFYSISRSDSLYYYIGDYKLCYYYNNEHVNKTIEYHMFSQIIHGHVYYSNDKDNTVIERFKYNYETNEYECLSMQCSNMNDLVKLMKKYITLLYEE